MSSRGAGLVALALLASGCGTIVVHPRQSFSLQSIPDDAHFELREAHEPGRVLREGRTPAPFSLHKGRGYFEPVRYSVVVSKEGYESRMVEFTPSVSGWYWANLLMTPLLPLWPMIGMLIVDPLDGGMWELEVPRAVMLEKLPAPPPAPSGP